MEANMDSILVSVKYSLGVEPDDKSFDPEIILHINSVFTILYQLGVGPSKLYTISGEEETWGDFFGPDPIDTIPLTKSYVYLKVRLLFDPPQSGVLHEAMERQTEEYEWRLNVQAETPVWGEEVETDAGSDEDE